MLQPRSDWIPTDARNMQIAVVQIQQCAVAGTVDCLWEVELPAKSQVQGQILGYAPGVLSVEEGALLEFLGVG